MSNGKGGCFFLFDQRFLNPVGFKLLGEPQVQSGVGLGVGGLPGVWEVIQEVGHCNRPPCLRNRLLPKSVNLALGLLGVSDAVPVDLEELDVRDGWILESKVDREGAAEVTPLLVEILLGSILCSYRSYSFLRSVEITQEIRSGDGREIFHKF